MDPDSPPENAPCEPATSWRVHPAADRPQATAIAMAVIAAISGLTWLGFGGPIWGLLAALVLLGSLQRFFFPSTYELSDEGMTTNTILGTRRIKWSEVQEFRLDANGGFLSRTAKRRRFGRLRGQFVLFDQYREAQIAAIRGHLEKAKAHGQAESQQAKPTLNHEKTA